MPARSAWLATLSWTLPTALCAASLSWPQFDFDSRKSGVSQQETTIHAGNVATLHLVASYPVNPVTLPAIADGAPAFLAGVATASGTKDLLFLTTKDGRLLAIDAATGATVWQKQPATSPMYTTSSPALDPSQLYVYSYGLDGKAHKYQVGSGNEVVTGGWPEVATVKPSVEKGSAALAVVTAQNGTSYLVVANGGYPGDAGDYQGHVTVINLGTGAQHVFNADCSNQIDTHFVFAPGLPSCSHVQSAIWARPGVVYDAELDRLFMSTGNGDYDANTGGFDWGDSVFALHPDGTGSSTAGVPIDSYTPSEYQTLQNLDADLGSTAPAILPSPNGSNHPYLGVQSGKDAQIRLLNLQNLSGQSGPRHLGGELQKIAVPQGGEVLTQPAVWKSPADGTIWVFIANDAGISGQKLQVDGAGNPSLQSPPQWLDTTNGGTSPIVVNGILYYSSFAGLRALDPATGTQLWISTAPSGLHWESPIVVGGRVYATDDSGHLFAWEPNPEPLDFYTVPPCRMIDTRNAVGPYGGPALQAGGRNFAVASQCGVPASARAIAVNVTVIGPTSSGFLAVGPTGVSLSTSTVNFAAGQTRANNAVVGLTGNPLASLTVVAQMTGTANLALDVVGYFK